MTINTVILDLDGTLVDSAESILNSLQVAFDEVGTSLVQSLTSDLIGPPLQDIITKLLHKSDIEALPRIAAAFTRHYDEMDFGPQGCIPLLACRGLARISAHSETGVVGRLTVIASNHLSANGWGNRQHPANRLDTQVDKLIFIRNVSLLLQTMLRPVIWRPSFSFGC
jgi:hypothetical protein